MSVTIRNSSRLIHSNLLTLDDREFWELPNYPDLSGDRDDDIRRTVTNSDRMDLLANEYYGDPILWWVIALANDLELVPRDLVILKGQEIRIPAPSFVFSELLKAQD